MGGRFVRVGLAFGLVAGLSNPSWAAPACSGGIEQDARAVRDFQTMLMVSALQCARQSPQTLASYNQFVSRTRPILASAGDTLRKSLVAIHGNKDGQRAYDRQVTAVANEQSLAVRAPDWCQQASALASEAASLDRPALVVLARASLGRSAEDQCRSD